MATEKHFEYSIFNRLSFLEPSNLFSIETAITGGLTLATLKNEKGAKFGMPDSLKLAIQLVVATLILLIIYRDHLI